MQRTAAPVILLLLAGTLALPACKSSQKTAPEPGLRHEGGIPVLPRGRITLAAAKGEKYLVEVQAEVPVSQAAQFYERQLRAERWEDVVVQPLEGGLIGITAHRGLFDLTGRIKTVADGRVSIAFERAIRKEVTGWRPPVPADVPVLEQKIIWDARVFQADAGRVEIRGKTDLAPAALRTALGAALREAAWEVVTAKDPALLSAIKRPRTVWYRVESLGAGAQVRLSIALDEVGERGAEAPAATGEATTPATAADAGVDLQGAASLTPLPPELQLWPTQTPVMGRRLDGGIADFAINKACTSAGALFDEAVGLLQKKGFQRLVAEGGGPPAGAATTGGAELSRSATFMRARRAVVLMVSQEAEQCTVQLTVTETK
jgi:hypothetical protein